VVLKLKTSLLFSSTSITPSPFSTDFETNQTNFSTPVSCFLNSQIRSQCVKNFSLTAWKSLGNLLKIKVLIPIS
jgi:hypothetical protein